MAAPQKAIPTAADHAWVELEAKPIPGRSNGDNYVILRMNRKPVNSFNGEFLRQIEAALDRCERDSSLNCKAVLLASALPSIFSAGLDIREMYKPTKESYFLFWNSLRSCFMRLYSFPLPTIAVIRGQCPAAGCLFAMACDVRLMQDSGSKYGIGLNETQLGIVAPDWFMTPMIEIVGKRQADRLLQLGSMIKDQEALRIGLVDALYPEDQLFAVAEKTAAEWAAIPSSARMITKSRLRSPLVEQMKKEPDTPTAYALTTSAPVQAFLGKVLERLSSGAANGAAKKVAVQSKL